MTDDDLSLRDRIAQAITSIPTVEETEPSSADPPDEIVEAIVRQLDVLEGTAVVLSNVATMLHLQIQNLRAEVGLFSQPAQESEGSTPTPLAPPSFPTETIRQRSGAVSEATLPAEKRLPDFCLHDDALVIDTAEGKVRVCPDCDAEAGADDG